MSSKIRVIVVDDSALVRSLLSEIINRQPDMECVATANDPLVARELIRELDPDVITLDVEMPHMDGIDFLGRLMRLRPMPVVMISAEGSQSARLEALDAGAEDVLCKPLDDTLLLARLRSLLRAGADDAALDAAIAQVWQNRDDRYSEIRTAETAARQKIEMSYIGG